MMKANFYKKMITLLCLVLVAPIVAMQPVQTEQTSLSHLPKEIQEMIILKIAEIQPSQEVLDKLFASIEKGRAFWYLPTEIKERIHLRKTFKIKVSKKLLDHITEAIQNSSDKEATAQLLAFIKERENVLQKIKNIGMVNKKLYQIVNNLKNTDYFIRTIAQNWGYDLLLAAIELGTPGAKQWIQEYIKIPKGLKEAKDLLFASIDWGKDSGAPFIYALTQAGLDINTVQKGWTPLIYATKKGDIEMITYLLKHGADKNYLDSEGKKAIDYIKYYPESTEYRALAELLK